MAWASLTVPSWIRWIGVALGVVVVPRDGEDLRDQPLSARKRRLRQILPRGDSRLLYVDLLERRGSALFHAACERDLEGIVAKWRHGRYERDGVSTSWLKIKNPAYSQMAAIAARSTSPPDDSV
jgi:ATP-dependent DNA ligase